MLIQVLYQSNEYGMVNPELLDELIASGKIKKFLRSEGWTTIGIDPIRGMGGHYTGSDRRNYSLLQSNDEDKTKERLLDELTRLRRRVDELEQLESDNRRLTRELRLSEKKYRTVADFTYDWEEWIGPNGKFIYVSPSSERITGYSHDKFKADPELVIKITHPEDHDLVRKHFHEVMSGSVDVYHIDFRIIHRSGDVRWISHYCQPVYEDGIFLGRRASNRDITKRKKAWKEIQELNKELVQKLVELTEVNKELDAFSYTVSRDLKAPLVP